MDVSERETPASVAGSLHITRPGCDHHFFGNAMATSPIFMSFWDADSESNIENFELKKLTARVILNF